MSNPSQNHNRKSIRLKNYDYTQPGAYFITLVTHQREALFGIFNNEIIQLSAFGKMIAQEWLKLPKRFRTVQIDAFVVMPNHFHGIITIAEPGQDTGFPASTVILDISPVSLRQNGLVLQSPDHCQPLCALSNHQLHCDTGYKPVIPEFHCCSAITISMSFGMK